MIAFNEGAHTYLHIGRNKYYSSVSGLISMFKPKFDEPYWAVYTAIRLAKKMEKPVFSKYLMRTHNFDFGAPKFIQTLYAIAKKEGVYEQIIKATSQVQDEWHTIRDESCEKGTKFHEHKEREAYKDGFMKTNPKDINNNVMKIIDSKPIKSTDTQENPVFQSKGEESSVLKMSCKELYLLPDGYYPELIIWNDDYTLCGTADKVWINTIDGIRFIDIDDWKTNKEIKMPNRYMMNPPLSHLSDVNYVHYTLQISIYAWMLEKVGFKVRNLYLTHQREIHEQPQRYKLTYLKKEVETMLKWRQQQAA
jgi:hypothetical protein